MVERKFAGAVWSARAAAALRLPSSANRCSRTLREETTAISDMENSR